MGKITDAQETRLAPGAPGRLGCMANVRDVKPEPYDRGPSGIAGVSRNIGLAIGTEFIGVNITEIPPGKKSSYLHHHKHKEFVGACALHRIAALES